jgi:hypothetical protein
MIGAGTGLYSQHPKSGPSGFRMAIFPTLFECGYQMQNDGQTIRKPDTNRPVFE